MADAEKPQTRVPSVMQDPSAQAIARVYADAFLNAAGDQGETALVELASFLDDVLKAHPDFERVLLSGIINREDKLGLIDRVIAPRGSEMFTNFLRVLARHDRLDLLSLILAESQLKHETRMGRKRVQIRSAQVLSEETLGSIRARLDEKLPFDPILVPEVDTGMLGGVVIQIGDTVYDSSLRTRMKQLRDRLRQRSLHEIQSGRDRFSYPEGN